MNRLPLKRVHCDRRERGREEERERGHKGCPAANVAPSFSIKRRKSVATDYGLRATLAASLFPSFPLSVRGGHHCRH